MWAMTALLVMSLISLSPDHRIIFMCGPNELPMVPPMLSLVPRFSSLRMSTRDVRVGETDR